MAKATTWTCDASGATAESEALPEGWVTIDNVIAISGWGATSVHFDISDPALIPAFLAGMMATFEGELVAAFNADPPPEV